MLKSLRLKNWRSIRDAQIDFTPITVFIGANSSGKTNIIDALYFIRDMMTNDIMQAVYRRGGGEKIRTLGTTIDLAVDVEYRIEVPDYELITHAESLIFTNNRFLFNAKRTLMEGDKILSDDPFLPIPLTEPVVKEVGWGDEIIRRAERASKLSHSLHNIVTSRWQLLDENFMPPLVDSATNKSNVYVIDRCADNLIYMLDFMQNTNTALYEQLQDDFRYLLGHVQKVDALRTDNEVRVRINETSHPDKEAPTVSAGTARILAILTAVYALDIRNADMPGLVVIEEPETSLNPSLLKNFVDMLRGYT